MTSLRIFFVGGLISFRALFNFLSPWIFVPSLLVAPIFQILLFVYIGRSAALESDEFYVIGNAVQYAAVPCLFAMIVHDRRRALPADARLHPRQPGGRGCRSSSAARVPVIVNGFFVAAFSLVVGGADRRDRRAAAGASRRSCS